VFAQILAQTPNYTSVDTALLIVRVVFGLTLAMHGWQKFFTGGRMPGTAGWFDGMGMKPGKVMAPLAASTEIGAGLGFAIGLLTPLMSAGCVGIMLVAAWTVHREEFFIVKGGWEYNMVLATGTVGVAMIGPGRFSLRPRHRRRCEPARRLLPASGPRVRYCTMNGWKHERSGA